MAEAVGVELADEREHLLDQQRREAERRLVEDQQARLAHQPASDRQHLLLAARQRAGRLGPALLEAREDLDHAFEIARAVLLAAPIGAELEVVPHREIGKHAPPLGHLDQPRLDDAGRARAADLAAVEADRAAERPVEAADVVVQR
jgi:hypothetical protein